MFSSLNRDTLRTLKYRAALSRRHLIRPRASRRLRQTVADGSPPWNVQIGAGGVLLPDWLNTDVNYPTELWLDATKPWPFPPGTVARVFSDNVIEHLPLVAARCFLGQAFTALRSGGVIRTVTPDATGNVNAYLNDPQTTLTAMRARGQQADHPVDIVRSAFSLWGHHAGYVYDESALRAELEQAGFSDIRCVAVGWSDDPALRGIDRIPSDAEFYLAIEATKP